MMKATLAAVALTAFATAPAAFAGGKVMKEVVVAEPEATQWWNAELSTGWDSAYMFRGVNVIPGASIYWTGLSTTFNLTENDFLTIGTWFGFGLGKLSNTVGGGVTNYKELDVYANYTHTFGDLAVTLGYTFYNYLNITGGGGNLYQNELNAGAAYEFTLGSVTITPSVVYYFNLGPTADSGHGVTAPAAQYLLTRLDANIPLYKEIVSLAPWTAFGYNFRFNYTDRSNPASVFNGGNNWEVGLALPIQLSEVVSVSGYGAYSTQWNGLVQTAPNQFWGGASVAFSF